MIDSEYEKGVFLKADYPFRKKIDLIKSCKNKKAEILVVQRFQLFILVYFLVDYSIFAKISSVDCRRGCFLGKHKI